MRMDNHNGNEKYARLENIVSEQIFELFDNRNLVVNLKGKDIGRILRLISTLQLSLTEFMISTVAISRGEAEKADFYLQSTKDRLSENTRELAAIQREFLDKLTAQAERLRNE
jgi:hypothetical protein